MLFILNNLKLLLLCYLAVILVNLLKTPTLMLKLVYTLNFILGIAAYISLRGFTFIALFLLIIYAGGILIFLLFILLFVRDSRLTNQTLPLWWLYDYRFILIIWLFIVFWVNEFGVLSSVGVEHTRATELILFTELGCLMSYTLHSLSIVTVSTYELIYYLNSAGTLLGSWLHTFIPPQPYFWDTVTQHVPAALRARVNITFVYPHLEGILFTQPYLRLVEFLSQHYLLKVTNLWLLQHILDYNQSWLIQAFITYINNLDLLLQAWLRLGAQCLGIMPPLLWASTVQAALSSYLPIQYNLLGLTALTYFVTGVEILLGIGLGLLFGIIGGNIFLKK